MGMEGGGKGPRCPRSQLLMLVGLLALMWGRGEAGQSRALSSLSRPFMVDTAAPHLDHPGWGRGRQGHSSQSQLGLGSCLWHPGLIYPERNGP